MISLARWIRARRAHDAALLWIGGVNPGFPKKKKYCSGLVPVRTRSPALSTATSKSGFSTYTGTAIWKWFDWKQPNRLSSITVHFQRSRELNPHGAETCVPTERKHCNADSSGRWGIAVRTFRRTDAVCFYTFFFVLVPQNNALPK